MAINLSFFFGIKRLSGSAPFPGKTFDEIISRNKKCQVKFIPKYWDRVSPEGNL